MSGSCICPGSLSAGLLHGTVIEDLAFSGLNKTFCLPVKIKDWAGKRLDRTHGAGTGTIKGTADGLRNYCASLVIEKRHRYIVKSLADKIELAFKSNSIMVRREGAVRGVSLTVLYLPVGDKLGDGALSSLGLLVKVPITVPLERNSTKRTDDEESDQVGEVELLARFIR